MVKYELVDRLKWGRKQRNVITLLYTILGLMLCFIPIKAGIISEHQAYLSLIILMFVILGGYYLDSFIFLKLNPIGELIVTDREIYFKGDSLKYESIKRLNIYMYINFMTRMAPRSRFCSELAIEDINGKLVFLIVKDSPKFGSRK